MKILPPLPNYLIKSTNISLEIAGQMLDFRVTFNVFGEVLSVYCTFFDLPEEAQKLMFGANLPTQIKLIRANEKWIPFKVTMATFGYLKHSIWQPFYEETQALQNKYIDKYTASEAFYIKKGWHREVWKTHHQKNEIQFPVILQLLSEEQEVQYKGLKKVIKNSAYSLTTPLFSILFDLRKDASELQKACIEGMGKYRSNPNYKFLIKLLLNEDKQAFHSVILESIVNYSETGLEKVLIFYYQQNYHNVSRDSRKKILTALVKFPSPRTANIFRKHLFDENSEIAVIALNGMKKSGVSEIEIKGMLDKQLDQKKNINTVLALYDELKNKDLLPSSAILLALCHAKVDDSLDIYPRSITRLISKKTEKEARRILAELMETNHPPKQDIGLLLYAKIGGLKDIPRLISYYKDSKLINMTLSAMEDICLYRRTPENILDSFFQGISSLNPFAQTDKELVAQTSFLELTPLLNLLTDKNETRKSRALKLLNFFLKNGKGYETKAVAPLIACLSKSNSKEIRERIYVAMRFLKGAEVIEALVLAKNEEKEAKLRRSAANSLLFMTDYPTFKKRQEEQRKAAINELADTMWKGAVEKGSLDETTFLNKALKTVLKGFVSLSARGLLDLHGDSDLDFEVEQVI